MLYRLFTENKNKDDICEIVSTYYEGFTVFEAVGYWKGKKENSLCIEILTDYQTDIATICQAIKQTNTQDAVLVQKVKINHHFL